MRNMYVKKLILTTILLASTNVCVSFVDPTMFNRMFSNWRSNINETITNQQLAAQYIEQIKQLEALWRQIEMAKTDKDLFKSLKQGQGNDTDNSLNEACKYGQGSMECGAARYAAQEARQRGGYSAPDETPEYSVSEYAAGDPNKRRAAVAHEIEKNYMNAIKHLRDEKNGYNAKVALIEKDLEILEKHLMNTANATQVAQVQTMVTITIGKLQVLAAQLESIKTETKLLDHKYQTAVMKGNLEAQQRGREDQMKEVSPKEY